MPELTLPTDAEIATLNAMDGVGTLKLSDGTTLRFGASACRGFIPVVGAKVRVTATRPHPLGGLTAASIELNTPAAEFDAMSEARDKAAGVHKQLSPEEAAFTSFELGWIIVMFDAPVPTRAAAFTEWASRLGLLEAGVHVEPPPLARLGFEGAAPLVYPGDAPIPPKLLARIANAPEGFGKAGGFLGLSLGLPNTSVTMRLVTGDVNDPWDATGRIRGLSKLAALLVRHGPGVILPRAHFALPRDAFLKRLGDLDDPNSRPFSAWSSLSWDEPSRRYWSHGMSALEFPDVTTTVQGEGSFAKERAKEAALFACHTMVHRNSALKDGERLQVPVGLAVNSNFPIDLRGSDLQEYQVGFHEGAMQLTPTNPRGIVEKWGSAPDQVARTTYESLFANAMQDWHQGRHIGSIDLPARGDAPLIIVEVHHLGRGVMMNTIGAGRKIQPGGTHRIELIAVMAVDHPFLARVLGVVASALQAHPPSAPYKVGDTINMPVDEIGAAGFVLNSAGRISFGAGDTIELVELVPLSAQELDLCRQKGSEPFLNVMSKPTIETRGPRWAMRKA